MSDCLFHRTDADREIDMHAKDFVGDKVQDHRDIVSSVDH